VKKRMTVPVAEKAVPMVVRDVAAIARDPRPPHNLDLAPIFNAAEKAGLQVTSVAVLDGLLTVQCGPHVPAFAGDITSIAAAIAAYNCKHCGTGGGHHPNCGRPR
jgi:hypothetical protein